MKDLVIRDDDFSYWTDPAEVEDIYSKHFENKIRVTFGVIPFAAKSYNLGQAALYFQEHSECVELANNNNAINFLKKYAAAESIEIALHGFEHKYFFWDELESKIKPATYSELEVYKGKSSNENPLFIGEFNNGDYDVPAYFDKIRVGKEYLEDIFWPGCIKTFIPPSNQMCSNALTALRKQGLDISGIYYKSQWNLKQRFLRVYYPKKYNLFYPYVLSNSHIKELNYHSLTTVSNFDNLIQNLETSAKLNAPFQIATHYWELTGDIKLQLDELIKTALKLGYQSRRLFEVFRQVSNH